jgi:RNA 3'-terminal phosphate cyclase (ATP)
MLTIDGSEGEGGGQILRTALALSMVTCTPFRIVKIRAGRTKPGLLRQHLTAVQAAAKISGAKLEGAGLGSQDLIFWPEKVRSGDYHFAIGTAGSTTLVLQSVLPALMLATGTSRITLEGGTHNPHAPPVDFLQHAFLPIVARMGPQIHLDLERYGFYPAGGGRFSVVIEPAQKLTPLSLLERGEITFRLCEATVAGLSNDIAHRELKTVATGLNWPEEVFSVRRASANPGAGNILTIQIGSQYVREVFTGFGERGIRAEAVGAHALEQAQQYLAANVPVGPFLADQLLIPFALAGTGCFATTALTRHAQTNINIIRCFLRTKIESTRSNPEKYQVTFG